MGDTMDKLLDNLEPSTFSLSAISIGFILSSDLTPAEKNSVGNWFMLVGQVLCTNAGQEQVLSNNKNNSSSNSNNLNKVKDSVAIINNELNNY